MAGAGTESGGVDVVTPGGPEERVADMRGGGIVQVRSLRTAGLTFTSGFWVLVSAAGFCRPHSAQALEEGVEATVVVEEAAGKEEGEEDDGYLLDGAPEGYICPISLTLMTSPVVAADGVTYQQEALEAWQHHTAQSEQMESRDLPLCV